MRVPLTVNDFLNRAELVYGDRIAVVDEPEQPAASWGSIDYREMARRGRAIAAGLDALGIGVGERVAMVSHNSARLMTALFGVSGSGRILVPVNFRLTAEEISYIVAHCGARILLVDPEIAADLESVKCEMKWTIGDEGDAAIMRFDIEPREWTGDEDATATINYTSGTTARPKGVQLTHRNIWLNASIFGWHMGVSDRDVYLHTLPQFHCNGWGMLYAVTGMGGRHIIQRKIDGHEILRRVEREGVTLMCAAPAVLNTVLDAAAEWDGLEPHQRAVRLSRAGVPVIGSTIAVDNEGEVLARGNMVMEGYWEQPEATAEAIRDGYFHTGDGGVLGEHHYLTITDRKKDVINSGAENVSSIEVEDVIFRHPSVAEVAVIGIPDEKWGEAVLALVVVAPGATLTEHEVISWTKEHLAGYKAPKQVEFREVLARTATGKLQKFKLREPYWAGRERQIN